MTGLVVLKAAVVTLLGVLARDAMGLWGKDTEALSVLQVASSLPRSIPAKYPHSPEIPAQNVYFAGFA